MILDLDGDGPRYQQLTRALSVAIRDGRLAPGSRVPASRELAREQGCSRNIVLLAYDQLLAEGYLVAHSRAGTFVSPNLAPMASAKGRQAARPAREFLTRSGRRLVRASDEARAVTRRETRPGIDFMHGFCEPDARVVSRMKQGVANTLTQQSSFLYGPPAGDERLRAEVARRLHGARGIQRSPEQIVITNGAQQALDLCARLVLSEGDEVVVEDPGYEAARAAFTAAGATVVPVPVDGEGLDPTGLPRRRRRVRMVYVTPSHQFPTGAIMTAARRQALTAWARRHKAHVIEDDYDGELRYGGRPIKALAAHEADEQVIYCGTFAKALFPSVRLGYLSLPESFVHAAVSAKWLLDRGSSILLQRVVADLMASGEYDRHLRRLHRRYAARRDVLVRELNRHLGSDVVVSGDAAGLHLVAWFPALPASSIDALVSKCLSRGVGIYSLARHALLRPSRAGVILGYGLLDQDKIEAGVRILATAVKEVRRAGSPKSKPERQ